MKASSTGLFAEIECANPSNQAPLFGPYSNKKNEWGGGVEIVGRHNSSSNVVFFDGHVESVNLNSIPFWDKGDWTAQAKAFWKAWPDAGQEAYFN